MKTLHQHVEWEVYFPTSASVQRIMPTFDIVVGTKRLGINAPETRWEFVAVDPLGLYVLDKLLVLSLGASAAGKTVLSRGGARKAVARLRSCT